MLVLLFRVAGAAGVRSAKPMSEPRALSIEDCALDIERLLIQGKIELLKRVLIGNRGEIAVRIAKAASGLGLESIAVYAPVDALSLHTRFATEAHEIGRQDGGAGHPVDAYLDAEALVRIARSTGCDCVHPGYGFLSENAGFAE